MFNLVTFIPLLGVIIFVHEFGHFLTAKLFGMRVFIFSFGFGKRLVGFKWGDTDCRISLVPLGGYVKLEGEPEDYLSDNTTGEGESGDPSMMKVPLADGTMVEVENPKQRIDLLAEPEADEPAQEESAPDQPEQSGSEPKE